MILIALVMVAGAYLFALPKGIHYVIHQELRDFVGVEDKTKKISYDYKVNSNGTQTSTFTEGPNKLSVTSVVPDNILDTHLQVNLKNIKKDFNLDFSVHYKYAGTKHIDVQWKFQDIDYTTEKKQTRLFITSPQIVTTIPVEAFKTEDRNVVDIITRSKIAFQVGSFSIANKDKKEAVKVKQFNYDLGFKDTFDDFFIFENNITSESVVIPVSKENALYATDMTNFKQKISFDSFHRGTIKTMIKEFTTPPDPKGKNKGPKFGGGMMAAMKHLDKLLPKDGADIGIDIKFTAMGEENILKGSSTIPMPFNKIVQNGPELDVKIELFEKIFPLFMRQFLAGTYADKNAQKYELANKPPKDPNTPVDKKAMFKNMMALAGEIAEVRDKMAKVLMDNYFDEAKTNAIIDQLISKNILVKKGNKFIFNAEFRNKKLVINDLDIKKDFKIDPLVDEEVIKRILLSNGFMEKNQNENEGMKFSFNSFQKQAPSKNYLDFKTRWINRKTKKEMQNSVLSRWESSCHPKNISKFMVEVEKQLRRKNRDLKRRGLKGKVNYHVDLVPLKPMNKKSQVYYRMFRSFEHNAKKVKNEMIFKGTFKDCDTLNKRGSVYAIALSDFTKHMPPTQSSAKRSFKPKIKSTRTKLEGPGTLEDFLSFDYRKGCVLRSVLPPAVIKMSPKQLRDYTGLKLFYSSKPSSKKSQLTKTYSIPTFEKRSGLKLKKNSRAKVVGIRICQRK